MMCFYSGVENSTLVTGYDGHLLSYRIRDKIIYIYIYYSNSPS